MRYKSYQQPMSLGAAAVMMGFAFIYFSLAAQPAFTQQKSEPPQNTTDDSNPVVAAFKKRVKQYVEMRERLEGTLPKLSKDATPEEIKGHEQAFTGLVQKERTGAKTGDVFTADIASYIRTTIQANFKGTKRERLKKTVLDEKPTEVKLRVNVLYPPDEKVVTMPPTLLLKLPELPKQLRYEFVGRHLILLDRETRLIIDYLLNALPQ